MNETLISFLPNILLAVVFGWVIYALRRRNLRNSRPPIGVPLYALRFRNGLRVTLRSGERVIFESCDCHHYAVYRTPEGSDYIFVARVAGHGGYEIIKRYRYEAVLDIEHLN